MEGGINAKALKAAVSYAQQHRRSDVTPRTSEHQPRSSEHCPRKPTCHSRNSEQHSHTSEHLPYPSGQPPRNDDRRLSAPGTTPGIPSSLTCTPRAPGGPMCDLPKSPYWGIVRKAPLLATWAPEPSGEQLES